MYIPSKKKILFFAFTCIFLVSYYNLYLNFKFNVNVSWLLLDSQLLD